MNGLLTVGFKSWGPVTNERCTVHNGHTTWENHYSATMTLPDTEETDECAIPNFRYKADIVLPTCSTEFQPIVEEFKDLFQTCGFRNFRFSIVAGFSNLSFPVVLHFLLVRCPKSHRQSRPHKYPIIIPSSCRFWQGNNFVSPIAVSCGTYILQQKTDDPQAQTVESLRTFLPQTHASRGTAGSAHCIVVCVCVWRGVAVCGSLGWKVQGFLYLQHKLSFFFFHRHKALSCPNPFKRFSVLTCVNCSRNNRDKKI